MRRELVGPVIGVLTTVALVPLAAAFVLWSGRVLTDRRVSRRQLLPGALLVAGLGVAVAIGSDVYVPRLFNSYASRYGAIGAAFALISWLFVAMLVFVGSTAVGREVWAELEAIRRGDRPSNAQIEAEWAAMRAQVDQRRRHLVERTRTTRERMGAWRGGRRS
jgi:membrane protein